jgi:hypothetical protein
MSNVTLDASAVATIQADMNVKTSMLSDEQLNALAQKLNEKFNIPILGEKIELIVFAKIIRLIDAKLYELLPNEYYSLVNSVSDGISDEDAALLSARLGKLLNEKINVPFLSEEIEGKLIGFVLDQIVNAMKLGLKLESKILG